MASTLETKYKTEIKDSLKKTLKLENAMQVPSLLKIVINRGVGEAVGNSKVIETSMKSLHSITGQKPVVTRAKDSISNFKIREGQAIGCKVTLRGPKMYDFLTKFINVVLPQIKDFRGVSEKSFDGRGNYTLGIKDETIFPEIRHESVDRIRGFDITFVTSSNSDNDAFELLKAFNVPFRKKG